MSDCVLVAVANKRYIEPAKALFYGAFQTGRWRDDMVLLPLDDVPPDQAHWFTSRGVTVQRFKSPLPTHGLPLAQAAQFHKLNVFRPFFKRWKRVIYLDCDILLLRDMTPLRCIPTHNSLLVDGEDWPTGLASQFSAAADPKLYQSLLTKFPHLSQPNFNTSSMVYETTLLEDTTFDTLASLLKEYLPILKNGDQPVLNLHFHQRWRQLPPGTIGFFQAADSVDPIGLHFCNWNAPWTLRGTQVETLWRENLASAERVTSLLP